MKSSWFVAAYAAVLAAELVGDKSLVSAGAIATRYRAAAVLCGLALAFMGKSLVAVLVGGAIARLPPDVVTAVSALAFFFSAAAIWRRREGRDAATARRHESWGEGAAVAFSAVFLTEWADPGQITTAALAARSGAPFAVWIGATLALWTKGVLAVTLGAGLSRVVPERVVRLAGAAVCLLIGIVTALRVRV